MMSNAPCGKSTSNISQSNEKRSSARWDDFSSVKFIELCEDEIGKGSRPNSHFNINGWKNMVKRFNEMTGKNYDYKQLRNHWDGMKKDWILFKKLMNKETAVDLRFFSDIAATEERARAPTQISENELNCEQEMLVDDGESNKHEKERAEVGNSDDIETIGTMGYGTNFGTKETTNEIVFPSFDTVKRKLCEENDKGKKKVFGAAALKEDIFEMLRNVPGIAPPSELWNYACKLLSKKELREIMEPWDIRACASIEPWDISNCSLICSNSFDNKDNTEYEMRFNEIRIDLCHELTEKYDLYPTRGMPVYEEVGIFLIACAHGVDNRLLQEDCIGAIAGTHVKARLPQGKAIPYIGHKGFASQNILAVVDFNMCFTFAWAGWEGAAHDNRIFGEVIRRTDLNFHVPKGKKYRTGNDGYSQLYKEKIVADEAFKRAENESYYPDSEHLVGTSSGATNIEDENIPNNAYWMTVRDSIAVDIARSR
ncbi:hypothetical protein BUALT_Bualt01G0178200 [Buddleja alternifolia]|uniref:Myb/SANT-like domain-containing protein n=1 Tax=Buddleja alternifolia TaxID=168488 RepID=A0AAV6YIF7_9LAMI|nr:hypothetical protein BUALT_Bualt01G0178200 [Buddleja alternifolia]